MKEKEQKDDLTKKHKQVLKNIERYLKSLEKFKDIVIILHMAWIIYLKKTIMNQQNLRVLLMVVIYNMKAEEIEMLNYR